MEEMPDKRSSENENLKQTQARVNEVIGIMYENVEKAMHRNQQVEEMESRAETLRENGKQFELQAKKLEKKYWWKNIKFMVCLAFVGFIVLMIVIGTIAYYLMDDNNLHSENGNKTYNGTATVKPASFLKGFKIMHP